MLISLLAFLSGCALLDPEKAGIYGCDEYCVQLIDRAETCAEESGLTLDEFVSSIEPDWADKGRDEIELSCDERLLEKAKTEAQCAAETGTFNNLPCDDILGVVGAL